MSEEQKTPVTQKKICKKCNQDLDIQNYYKAGSYYQSLCRTCHNARRTENYRNNRVEKQDKWELLNTEQQNEILQMIKLGSGVNTLCRKLKCSSKTYKKLEEKHQLKTKAATLHDVITDDN